MTWVVIGFPIGYFVIERWLENFAFHLDVHAVMFVIAASSALLFAVFGVATQTPRVATAKLLDAPRDE